MSQPVTLEVGYMAEAISYNGPQQGYVTGEASLRKLVFNLSIVPLHAGCSVTYNSTKLSLPDNFPFAWTPVSVAGVSTFAQQDPSWPLTVKAQAFRYFANNTNSYPAAQEITDQMPFAVYCQFGPDFYDPALPEWMIGTDKASGLMWARVTSYRNGHEFSYSCETPPIIRDPVSLCPNNLEDSYQKLPLRAAIQSGR